jgi:hypothetical protein
VCEKHRGEFGKAFVAPAANAFTVSVSGVEARVLTRMPNGVEARILTRRRNGVGARVLTRMPGPKHCSCAQTASTP